jgi:hypothetical protein
MLGIHCVPRLPGRFTSHCGSAQHYATGVAEVNQLTVRAVSGSAFHQEIHSFEAIVGEGMFIAK